MAEPAPGRRRRPIRVLMAKIGLDGHDVGVRVVARGLRDAGMEVIYTGLRTQLEQVVHAAIQEDVDWIGVSTLSGAHLALLPRLRQMLDAQDAADIRIIAGGVIPQEDIPVLERAGISRVVLAGTPISVIVDYLEAETP